MAMRSRGRDTLHEMMIWSFLSPVSIASAVDSMAEISIHSFRTSSYLRPNSRSLFSCIFAITAVLFKALLVATRPTEETIEAIYSFDTASSTEWAYPRSFVPDMWVDISETLDTKLADRGW